MVVVEPVAESVVEEVPKWSGGWLIERVAVRVADSGWLTAVVDSMVEPVAEPASSQRTSQLALIPSAHRPEKYGRVISGEAANTSWFLILAFHTLRARQGSNHAS